MKSDALPLTLIDKNQLTSALDTLITWLIKSFEKNDALGSSKYQNYLGLWSEPYPETTAYLIPSLLQAAAHLKQKELYTIVDKQWGFFEKLQDADGGFFSSMAKDEKFFFDNSQILLGLTAAYNYNGSAAAFEKLECLYNWLINQIDYTGQVHNNNYLDNNTPSYYSRSVWALLHFEHNFSISNSPKTIALLNNISSRRQINGTYQNSSFDGAEPSLSHTVAYTLRGLYECGLILEDKVLCQSIVSSIDNMLNVNEEKNSMLFFGLIFNDWRWDNSFVCSTGHAQFCILLIKLFKKYGNIRYLNTARRLLVVLLTELNKRWHSHIRAIPSSIPLWGNYQPFRYTNWTQKFTCDAIMELIELDYLSESSDQLPYA